MIKKYVKFKYIKYWKYGDDIYEGELNKNVKISKGGCYYMKKFLTILLAVVTMTVNLGSSIFADDVEEASSFFMTFEPTMPELIS